MSLAKIVYPHCLVENRYFPSETVPPPLRHSLHDGLTAYALPPAIRFEVWEVCYNRSRPGVER